MWQQAACIDPGASGFIDQDPRLGFGSGGQGRFGAWFDWCLRDQGGLGRKAERIDRGEQLPAFDVLLPQLLVLLPQLLGFVLYLLRSLFDLLHPPFVLHLALFVTGIPSPVERRQQ